MTAVEQLQRVRTQLATARAELTTAEQAFDSDATVLLGAKVTTLVRFEASLVPQAQAEAESTARDAARQRLRGMRSAMGSHITSLAKDEQAVRDAVDALAAAIHSVNTRFGAIEKLRIEDEALRDRCGLVDEPPLRSVAEPAHSLASALSAIPSGARFRVHRPEVEQHPDMPGWSRRTYRDVADTPGGAIIAAVGAKDWPPVPAEILAARDRHDAQAAQNVAVIEQAGAGIPTTGAFSLRNMM